VYNVIDAIFSIYIYIYIYNCKQKGSCM
jgi:hypothetical protein